MSVEDLTMMKAGGLLPREPELLAPALQIAATIPTVQDPDVLRRVIAELDGPTIWDQTVEALGYFPALADTVIVHIPPKSRKRRSKR